MNTSAFAFVIACGLLIPSQAQQSHLGTDIPPCPPEVKAPMPDNMIRPLYPKEALRNGVAGTLVARVQIAPEGKTEDIVVLEGDPLFSKSAVAAIRKWRFHPMFTKGHPVETTYKIHVRFNPLLQEANSDVELESPQPDPCAMSELVKAHLRDSGNRVYRMSEPGVVAPKQIYAPEPEFSEKARKAKEQGAVALSLIVGTDGLPQDLAVACSSAPDLIDNAIEAVKLWRFAPGTKDGRPVPVAILVDVSFTLYND